MGVRPVLPAALALVLGASTLAVAAPGVAGAGVAGATVTRPDVTVGEPARAGAVTAVRLTQIGRGAKGSGVRRLLPYAGGALAVTNSGWHRVSASGATRRVELPPSVVPGQVGESVVVGSKVYVALGTRTAGSSGAHRELWAVEPATGSFTRITDRERVSGAQGWDPMELSGLVAVGDRLMFVTAGLGGERALWVSDGTPTGTSAAVDLGPAAGPLQLAAWGDEVVFTRGAELWVSDGTSAGTTVLVGEGAGPLQPGFPRAVGDALLFGAWSDGRSGLWSLRRGGVPQRVVAFKAGLEMGNGGWAGPSGTHMFALTGPQGEVDSVWTSDGTAAGTRKVLAVADPWGSVQVFAAGGRLHAVLSRPRVGAELVSLPTSGRGAIELVRDVRFGPKSSNITSAVADPRGNLWFTAVDGVNGREVWRTKPDRGVQGLRVAAVKPQKQRKAPVRVKVRVRAEEAVTVRVTGKVRVRGKARNLRAVRVRVPAGRARVVNLRLRGPGQRAALRALRQGGRPVAWLRVRVVDDHGSSVQRRVRVRLR